MSDREWEELADWWLREVAEDPAYRTGVLPLLDEVLVPEGGMRYLDLGCGEGQAMRRVAAAGARAVGVDLNWRLLSHAKAVGPVVCARLPELSWCRADVFDGAYAVLVIEHLSDLDTLFAEVARVVRPGGVLAIVANHPLYTAPGSAPIVDPTDGEVFWRWGTYLEPGVTREPAGDGTVTFHHRPLSTILNAAATAGWRLDRIVERAASPETVARIPGLAGQEQIPRLMGVRWHLCAFGRQRR